MTIFLFSKVTQEDFSLALVSIAVVFSALLILFFVYYVSGIVISGRLKRIAKAAAWKAESGSTSVSDIWWQWIGTFFRSLVKRRRMSEHEKIQADQLKDLMWMSRKVVQADAETAAAIAMALHLWMEENVHDSESYLITIDRAANERI